MGWWWLILSTKICLFLNMGIFPEFFPNSKDANFHLTSVVTELVAILQFFAK
jgi:hypothetical protein